MTDLSFGRKFLQHIRVINAWGKWCFVGEEIFDFFLKRVKRSEPYSVVQVWPFSLSFRWPQGCYIFPVLSPTTCVSDLASLWHWYFTNTSHTLHAQCASRLNQLLTCSESVSYASSVTVLISLTAILCERPFRGSTYMYIHYAACIQSDTGPDHQFSLTQFPNHQKKKKKRIVLSAKY